MSTDLQKFPVRSHHEELNKGSSQDPQTAAEFREHGIVATGLADLMRRSRR